MDKITIPEKAQIKIEWKDFPHNFSKEGIKQIKDKFSKKYNIETKQIKVIQVPLKIDKSGERVIWTDGFVENLLNIDNQRKLYKEWLKNEKIEEYDWNKIVELDDIANSEIIIPENEESYGVIWEPIEMGLSNFLSFGEDIVLPWDNYNGLTLITSDPANTGGKTNLTVDAPMFILFGVTTKTDKNEEIFNLFSNKNCVKCYMKIKVFDDIYKIERTLTRKEKRSGGYTVTNKVQYYKIIENKEIELAEEQDIENQEGEQARETNKYIKNLFGSKDDFENIICATSKTLDNIIDSKVIGATERGKLLNKFIGLDIFDKKYSVINQICNTFKKSMKSNVFNKSTLEAQIDNDEKTIENNSKTIEEKEIQIKEKNKLIETIEQQKNSLMQSKYQIDNDVLKIDSFSLKKNINENIKDGVSKKNQKEELNKEQIILGDLEFDKDVYNKLILDDKTFSIEKSNIQLENKKLLEENNKLEKEKTCPTCNRPMVGVNNQPKIEWNIEIINKNNNRLIIIENELKKIQTNKIKLEEIKEKIDRKNKIELLISKLDVEMGLLREKIINDKQSIKKYEENKDNIDKNNEIDIKLNIIKANLNTEISHRQIILNNIETLRITNENIKKQIDEKKSLIKEIDIEEYKLKQYNLYLSLVDPKRGVSKIVLKNCLPIINYTVNEMLGDDVCDFEIELDLNSANDVEIYIIRDSIKSKIKSSSGFESVTTSLALRVVFSRLTTISKPNFLILDEIFGGKVAEVNFEKIFLVVDKMKKYFNTLFLITHDEKAKEYADNLICINKINNISKILN